jgi:hypothetical protein
VQLNTLLTAIALLMLTAGLLCLALSQRIHFHNPAWAPRLNRLGLATTALRRLLGILLLLLAACLLIHLQGTGFGLVVWLMTGSVISAGVACLLAPS